jgi:hypothetical protein
MRISGVLMLGLVLAVATPAAARPSRAQLTIDDDAPVRVTSGREVRRALARCARPDACSTLVLEDCDRCILSSSAEAGGFSIYIRHGPPGPEYLLFDNRPGRGNTAIFSAADMIEIFAGYLHGRTPGYVGRTRTEG